MGTVMCTEQVAMDIMRMKISSFRKCKKETKIIPLSYRNDFRKWHYQKKNTELESLLNGSSY